MLEVVQLILVCTQSQLETNAGGSILQLAAVSRCTICVVLLNDSMTVQTQFIKSASRWGSFWVGKEAAGQAGTRARLLGSAIRKPRRLKSSLL